jgi:hypothetical protein
MIKGNRSRPETEQQAPISKLSDAEFEKYLRAFLQRIMLYSHLFEIDLKELEKMRKQQLAFSWLHEMSMKLNDYVNAIKKLKKTIKTEPNKMYSLLDFYDLPRPPVLYVESDLQQQFYRLVEKVKSSKYYTEGVGRDLGIERLGAPV